MPTILKVAIIFFSLCFILGLYVLYPWWHNKNSTIDKSTLKILPNETSSLEFEEHSFRDLNTNLYLGFAQFRSNMGKFFAHGISLLMVVMISCMIFFQWVLSPYEFYETGDILLSSFKYGGFPLFFMYWIIITYALMILTMIYRKEPMTVMNKMVYIKLYFINMLLITSVPLAVFYFAYIGWMILIFFFFPPHFIAYIFYMIPERGWKIWSDFGDYYNLCISSWGRSIVTFILAGFLHLILVLSLYSVVGSLFLDFISWHDMFSGLNVTNVFTMTTIYTFIFLLMLPLYYYIFINQMNSEKAKSEATDLWRRFDVFNNDSSVFETKS